MNRILFFFLSWSIFCWSADLVKFPSGDAQWVITLTSPAPAVQNSPSAEITIPTAYRTPTKIEMTRTGKIQRMVISDAVGVISEEWLTDQYLFTENIDKTIQVTSFSSNNIPYQRYDESFFSWVQSELFIEEQHFRGKKAFLYRNPQEPMAEAWIDPESKLPLYFKQNGYLLEFKFLSPPKTALLLPFRFQAELLKVEKSLALPKRLGD